MPLRPSIFCLLAASLAVPGPAADPAGWDRPAYGLLLGLADAEGDFRNVMGGHVALETGLSARFPLGARFAVRPTVEYQRYAGLEHGDLGNESERWSAWSFGADGIYRPAGTPAPFYFVAGAYLKMWRLHSYGAFVSTDKVNGTQSYAVNDASTKNEPALALGMGLILARHATLETRMTFASYRKQAYNSLHVRFVLTL